MTTTKCLTCQVQAKRDEGRWLGITDAERSHWMLWGCTCSPEALAEALAYMDRITRAQAVSGGVCHAVRPAVHPNEGMKSVCGRRVPTGETVVEGRVTCEVCRRMLAKSLGAFLAGEWPETGPVAPSWEERDAAREESRVAPHPDERPRIGLEDLYVALEVAIVRAADLVVLAQALLPDETSRSAFVALQELCILKQRVNPDPTEEDVF